MGSEVPLQAESLEVEDSLEPEVEDSLEPDLVHPSSDIHSKPEIAEPPAKKQKVSGQDALHHMQRFMVRNLQRMKAAGCDLATVTALTKRKIVITGRWSGAGTMGISWAYFAEAVKEVWPEITLDAELYSECDWNEDAQTLLSCLDPVHLHGNLLDQFEPFVVKQVTRLQNTLRKQLTRNRAGKFGGKARRQQKQKYIDMFVLLVRQLVRMAKPFKESCPCLFHDKKCPVAPPNKSDIFWMELMSPSCTAWSSRGLQGGWADPTNLPLILHCARWSDERFRPHFILVECTPRLDLRSMEALSNFKVNFSSIVADPVMFGVNADGQRVWAVSPNAPFYHKYSPFLAARLQQFVHEEPSVDPSTYCSAKPAEITEHAKYLNARMGARGAPLHPRGKSYNVREIMAVGYKNRLREHEQLAERMRVQADPSPSVLRAQFWDIAQTVGHHKQPNSLIPRPLVNSHIWSEQHERLLLPVEVWAAQGSHRESPSQHAHPYVSAASDLYIIKDVPTIAT